MKGFFRTIFLSSNDHEAGNGPTFAHNEANKLGRATEAALGYEDIAEVRALGTPVDVFALTFRGCRFEWDATSLADDDGAKTLGVTAIQPDGHAGAGRWITTEVYQRVDADTAGTLAGKENIKPSNPYASISADLHTCFIGHGGHEAFPNIIGTVPGTGAHYSGILGYDNKADAIASAIWHFHGTTTAATNHPTLLGGSHGTISGGDYPTLLGGTANTINGGNYTGILSSRESTIHQGSGAIITGGYGHQSSGGHSSISGGLSQTVTADGDQAGIGSGGNNTVGGAGSRIGGGRRNTVDDGADYGNITGGLDVEVTGSYGRAGGNEASAGYGLDVWATGGFNSIKGSAQSGKLVARGVTTTATETNVFLNGSSLKPVIPENTAWAVKTLCVASDSIDTAAFEFTGLIYRGAGNTAASPTQNDAPVVIAATAGAASWGHRVTVSTNGAVNIKATGGNGSTIRWVVTMHITQLFTELQG